MDCSVMRLWRRLQTLTKLFRFVELCIVLILLTWMSSRLPFAVRISGEYCRKTAALVFCPTSVFLLGNAIVVALLAKSGLFSADGNSSAVDNAVADLYRKLRSDDDGEEEETETPSRVSDGKEEVVFQDKEIIICEEKVSFAVVEDDEKNGGVLPEEKKAVTYRRSKSENLRTENTDDMKKDSEKLRRSETDVCLRYIHGGGGGQSTTNNAAAVEEEGDGGEDFRRTIEAFIAKQVRFHREESLAVVVHGQA